MNDSAYKIAVTGPESTGKSLLARQLAEYYQTVWVPEFARSYIDQLERPYEKEDLAKIAEGQLLAEDQMLHNANKLLICDTELTVIKIWSQHKFKYVDPFVASNHISHQYDLYLLTNIDLPWEYDPQREHPKERKFFFNWFESELIKKNANYCVISGHGSARFDHAISFIDEFLIKSSSDQG